MKPLPITGERALFLKANRAIILADIHIGIEMEYRMQGVNISLQTDALLERCRDMVLKKNAERIIIAGDVKHIIPTAEAREERREVSRFLKNLHEYADVEVVKGNHDGNLRSKYAKIHSSRGIMLDDVAIVHGHSWPSPEIMGAEAIVMGHIHPHVRIATTIGYSYLQPCWVRGKFMEEEFQKKYGEGNKDMEFIIMPAFNPLCGGVAVNREKVEGALFGIMDIDNAFIYLLDAINLGRVRNIM